MKQNIIAVDFDGTLCDNEWPYIGMPNEEIIEYLKKRQANGEKIILWTNRVGERLDEVVKWSAEKGLIFDAVNENLSEIVEAFGSDCRKIPITMDDYLAHHGFLGMKWGVRRRQKKYLLN